MFQQLRYYYDDLSRLIRICYSGWDTEGLETPHTLNYYDDADAMMDDLSARGKSSIIPVSVLDSLDNLKGRMVASIAINRVNNREYYVADLFSYDDDGQVKTKYKVVPGLPLQVIDYTYDIHGKVISELFKCGSEELTKMYSYNKLGELEQIMDAIDEEVITYENDPLGRNSTKTFSKLDDNQVTNTFNIRGWLSSTSYEGSNGFFENISYTHTRDGSVTSFNGNIMNVEIGYENVSIEKAYSHDYTYDEVNRLTGVVTKDVRDPGPNPPVLPEFEGNYSYDEAGRFESKQEGDSIHDGYEYYKNGSEGIFTNRLKKSKNITPGYLYIYDEYGNMIIDMSKKMVVTYDWRHLPVQFAFYDNLPIKDDPIDDKIKTDDRGTGYVDDSDYTGDVTDVIEYVEYLVRTGEITRLSSVYMLYDASGKRVLKMSSN
jgi:hypothetical protein